LLQTPGPVFGELALRYFLKGLGKMNSVVRQILENVEALPPGMQREALDFVRSLKDRRKIRESAPETRDSDDGNRNELVRLMEKIAARGTAFREIEDPAEWQRGIRKDRPLPNREFPC
jgi:hypothetical protein